MEILKVVENSRFKQEVIIPDPEILIKINNKVVLVQNNFITISGMAKSRKTTFMNVFIGAALTSKEIFGIKVNLKENDKIVLIDTEQSIYDFSKQLKYLKKQISSDTLPKTFGAYLFRQYEPDVILKSIEHLMQEEKPKLLFIDNLTELVMDANDPKEAKKVVQFLKMITQKYNCGIVCLLHLGKGTGTTLGHLGSSSDRSAQSVLRVEIDKETQISTLSPTFLRSDAHFEPVSIQFSTNDGRYEQTETPKNNNNIFEKKVATKFSMAEYTDEEIKSRVQIIFELQSGYSYNALVEALKKIFGVGESLIKRVAIPYLVGNKKINHKEGIYTPNI